jgi:hypothetical protein
VLGSIGRTRVRFVVRTRSVSVQAGGIGAAMSGGVGEMEF